MEDVAHAVQKNCARLLPLEWFLQLINPEFDMPEKRLLIFRLTHTCETLVHGLRVAVAASASDLITTSGRVEHLRLRALAMCPFNFAHLVNRLLPIFLSSR